MLLNNRYEYNHPDDLLGTGGFGRVYKAYDILLKRQVALKIVSLEGNNAQYDLISEVQRAINFVHPNIVRFFDAFILKEQTLTGERETQIGVLEYVAHGNISHLKWDQLNTNSQKKIIGQLIEGLGYLHQNKIIHRDIKPSNILIHKSDEIITPKIIDFGISKMNESGSASISRMIGSIPYMAPEQFDSKGKIDFNTDFWSLGILIYHLFTGKLPFGDEITTSEGVIMKNIIEMDVHDLINEVPDPFRNLVVACLEKDRKKRVQSADELIGILHKIPKITNTEASISEAEKTRIIKKQVDQEEITIHSEIENDEPKTFFQYKEWMIILLFLIVYVIIFILTVFN